MRIRIALTLLILLSLGKSQAFPMQQNINNSTVEQNVHKVAVESKPTDLGQDKAEVANQAPVPKTITTVVQVSETPHYSGSHTDWLAAAGIPQSEWAAVDYIVTKESSWCTTRWNNYFGPCLGYNSGQIYGGSKAYGLCQSLPPEKMSEFGPDWQFNPVTQLKWCNSYAVGRYGGWWNAYHSWIVQQWW